MRFDPVVALGVINEYLEWMIDLICGTQFSKDISYKLLLQTLHGTEFKWAMRYDKERADDGMALRWRFALLYGYEDELRYLDGPCSMLEMMLALAIRCEDLMSDSAMGDRTSQWFWKMVVSLGLGAMTDEEFDEEYVDDVLAAFMRRDYEPNGRGGLFTLKHCPYDLRDYDIWTQLCWYQDTIM